MYDKIVTEPQDMRYLSWAKIRNSSGTAGSFLKAYDEFGAKKRYYKLSNFNPGLGFTGHECINEIIADRLLTILGVPHLEYSLIHANIVVDEQAYDTYLCMSYDFKEPGESKLALDTYYELNRRPGEGMLNFCIRQGWEQYIYQMLVVDYLIFNRDRHGANIEVLRNSRKQTLRLAPLFDHGLSFVCSCTTEAALAKFDVLREGPAQCCVGSNSTLENLHLIPQGSHPSLNPLRESDREVLMAGLEGILPSPWQEKIWEMLWQRWRVYEGICNQKR